MHSIDAAYFCARLSVCMLVTTMSPAKTDEPIEMPFGKQTRVGPRNQVTDGGCTLAPPGEYDRSICAKAAMQPVTTVSVAVCHCYSGFL